ncbi:hypothetical protein ABT294_40150 [Nonomuraea sp. NPDC000554]|uniref:hypothetical protein n=1 Tax=Nonomuraea sp. NPDC000554 TaxID=3154259 RepID=UPI003320A5AA
MTANEDLEEIRRAVTGRSGPAPSPAGSPGKPKKKAGPAPLPPDPAPVPPPPPRRRTDAGGVLGGIVLLVVAAFVINAWAGGGLLSRLGFDRPPWVSAAPGASRPDSATSSHAEKRLKISPKRGTTRTTITLTGSGFIRNGQVRLIFHSTQMGVARTDGKGRFKVRMRIPSPGFYGHFPGQTFSISTTEWTRDGAYEGNGPRAGFLLG